MEDIEVKCLKVSSEQIKNNYTFGKSAMKDLARYIDKTLDRLEQLEKENKELKEWKSEQGCSIQEVYELFIPKSVIREKIKEIRKKAETSQCIELLIFDSKRDILEEILGEK